MGSSVTPATQSSNASLGFPNARYAAARLQYSSGSDTPASTRSTGDSVSDVTIAFEYLVHAASYSFILNAWFPFRRNSLIVSLATFPPALETTETIGTLGMITLSRRPRLATPLGLTAFPTENPPDVSVSIGAGDQSISSCVRSIPSAS